MRKSFIRTAVRTLFLLSGRERVAKQITTTLNNYLALAEGLDDRAGACPIKVPPMQGVDEDMRYWSYFMILEHNSIVNRVISARVRQLAAGEPPGQLTRFNPKKDVMPSPIAGPEQLANFQDSINEHLQMVAQLQVLRGTPTTTHPIFGDFDAHKWNCMFSFHLAIHYKQAKYVVTAAREVNSD